MVDALAALSLVMGFTFPFWDFAFNARKKDECPPLEMKDAKLLQKPIQMSKTF